MNFEFIKSGFFENKILNRVEEKFLYQNPLVIFEKKISSRKIFRLKKNIPLRNILDSAAEFRILGIPELSDFIDFFHILFQNKKIQRIK